MLNYCIFLIIQFAFVYHIYIILKNFQLTKIIILNYKKNK